VSEEEDLTKVIPDEDGLLRGVPPDQWNFDEGRPGTGALNTDELCVDWAAKRTPDEFLGRFSRREQGHGLIRFKARMPRSHSLIVQYDPKPWYDPDNDAHTKIPGSKPKSFIKAVKRPDSGIELLQPATEVQPE
jgi:hypothetical protein